MAEDITFTDYKSKSKVCQQIQFTRQRFHTNFRMNNRWINGNPLYFDADGGMQLSMTDDNKRGLECGNQNQEQSHRMIRFQANELFL